MTALYDWLSQATRGLSKESAAQVRSEIREHYESAREATIKSGATLDDAERQAVLALGDAKAANCQYRKVLLTAAEARLLRQGNWEARIICSRRWMKWLMTGVPAAALLAAFALLLAGAMDAGRMLLAGGVAFGLFGTGPFLPVYTPERSRIFRAVKLVALPAALGLAFGADSLQWSWLICSSLWPMLWIEWTRVSIRRKLPVAQWPKQLYL